MPAWLRQPPPTVRSLRAAAGFFAGVQWEAQKHNPKKATRLAATAWTTSLAGQTAIIDDMGFRIWLPFKHVPGGDSNATRRAAANAKMGQWNATVGMFRS